MRGTGCGFAFGCGGSYGTLRGESGLGEKAARRRDAGRDREPLLRACERDVRESALGLRALAGGALLGGDVERAPVRQLALLAREQLHPRPLAALGAVDRGQLDPVLVVADRQQRIRAAFEQLQVAGDRQARGFGLRLVEHLELDLLGATEHRFVLLEVRVQAAAVP